LAVLNSRPISFWFAHKFGKLQRGLFPQFKINELASFPIPSCTKDEESKLAKLANNIMTARIANPSSDTSGFENQIDYLVYKLYGLTYDEVLIIDPNASITREDYESNK
jgi:hypothetical protein